MGNLIAPSRLSPVLLYGAPGSGKITLVFTLRDLPPPGPIRFGVEQSTITVQTDKAKGWLASSAPKELSISVIDLPVEGKKSKVWPLLQHYHPTCEGIILTIDSTKETEHWLLPVFWDVLRNVRTCKQEAYKSIPVLCVVAKVIPLQKSRRAVESTISDSNDECAGTSEEDSVTTSTALSNEARVALLDRVRKDFEKLAESVSESDKELLNAGWHVVLDCDAKSGLNWLAERMYI